MLTQSVVDGLLHENTLRYSKYLYIDPSISVSPEYLLVLVLQDMPYRCSYDRKVIQAEASYRKVFCDQAGQYQQQHHAHHDIAGNHDVWAMVVIRDASMPCRIRARGGSGRR